MHAFWKDVYSVFKKGNLCLFSHKSYHLTVSIVNKSVNYYVELYGTFLY